MSQTAKKRAKTSRPGNVENPRRSWIGEFYDPASPHDAQVWTARVEFFRAIERITPSVLKALRRDVLPLFAPLQAAFPSTSLKVGWRPYEQLLRKRSRESRSLAEALRTWARRFRLVAPGHGGGEAEPAAWCLDFALRTLAVWAEFPRQAEELRFHPTGLEIDDPLGPEDRLMIFSDEWLGSLQREEQFRSQARAKFELALDTFVKRTTEAYLAKGWKKAAVRRGVRTTGAANHSGHLEWLVRVQILDEDSKTLEKREGEAAIAAGRFPGPNAQSIRREVSKLARFIDLVPHRISPGRPRKEGRP